MKPRKKEKIINCSIGVMAYNEEKNIARALEALLSQKLKKVKIKEIYVIASGCTDRTIPIARRIAKTDRRIKLLTQRKREGKSSAVNLFLKHAKSEIVVLAGADTIPEEDVIEKMISPFSDASIGMTGAHSIPIDPENTFFGFAAHLLWGLAHQLSLSWPKLGEMVAKRLFWVWLKTLRFEPRFILWSPMVAFLEALARILGTYDFYFKKDKHTVWEIASSTKKLK